MKNRLNSDITRELAGWMNRQDAKDTKKIQLGDLGALAVDDCVPRKNSRRATPGHG